jgi:putative hydrolase of the HAD superfamily
VRPERALIFDLDDTLYNERRFALSGYAVVAAHVEATTGLPRRLVFRHLRDCLKRGDRPIAFQTVCDRFGIAETVLARWRQVFRTHEPRLRLPRATQQMLRSVRREWRVGILTNGLPEVQRRKVAALGLDSLVDRIVYAAEHGGIGKPRPEPFLAAARALRVIPERSVFVGNDPWMDVWGASQVGMHAVWLDRMLLEPVIRVVMPASPRAVIRQISEVPAVAERLVDRECHRAVRHRPDTR